MKIKIVKLQELPDALHPNNIEVGFEIIGEATKVPCVGERFWIDNFSTSGVQEIIDEKTFRTYSSIYHWEIAE